jgi:UDP-3-O-[3-hydroxymyristoyl] glucosamine N-acyltransferase
MSYTIGALAQQVGGQALGRAERQVSEITSIDDARESGISPFFQKKLLSRTTVLPGAVLAPPALARHALEHGVAAALAHEQPVAALAGLIDLFHPKKETPGQVHPTAFVDPRAEVHPTARIEPMAVVEAGAVVGRQSIIGPGAVICRGCRIGRYVRIGPGSVIGAEGFGVVQIDGRPVKLRHVGHVVVEDYVDIGANTCIDRGTLGTTIVGCGAKIDNQVQVGHNARIGRQVIMAAQVGLAGSTVIGDDVMIGGQAGVKDHIEIGAGAKVAGGCGVTRDVAPGEVVAGFPTLPRVTWLRAMARLKQLGQIPKPSR